MSARPPRRTSALPERFVLGGWTVEPRAGVLQREQETAHLEPKVMGVLVALAEAAGDVVERDALLARVWPDVVVTDSALNRSVSELRRTLGDDPRRPSFIETVPTVGYRLLVTPGPVAPDAPPVRRAPSGAGATGDGAVGDGATGDGHADAARLDAPPVLAATPPPAVSVRRPRRTRWVALVLVCAIGATIGVLLSMLRTPSFADAFASAEARVLTTRPGAETQPQLSPDGTRLAFVSQAPGGTPDLFVQSLTASAPTRIAENAASPAWSPDGTRLAFLRPAGPDGGAAVVAVTAYGTDEQVLTDRGVRTGGLSWSSAGDHLAFTAHDEAGPGLFLHDPATGTRRRLTRPGPARDHSPVFSPEGRRIAFFRSVGPAETEVLVLPVDGGEPTVLVPDAASVAGLAWTPAGDAVVFSSNRAGLYRLWWASMSGSLRALPVPSQDPGSPSISRTGLLAFADWQYDTNVWTATTDGAPPRATFPASGWDEEPALSPAGDRLAFVSTRSGAQELWAGGLGDAEPTRLTFRDGGAVRAPRWSPDGRWIAFQAQTDRTHDVLVVPSGGGTPRTLAAHPADDVNPRWSRDGRHVYFGSDRDGDWAVWRAALDGGPPERATPPGFIVAEEQASGAGLYAMRARRDTLVALAPDGRAEPAAPLAAADWNSWAVTARGLAHVDRSAAPARLVFSSGGALDLPALPPHAAAVSLSADGRTAAWTRVDRADNDVLVVEPDSP